MSIASYGILVRSSIYIIQWADYHKNNHEVRLKGSDFQTVVFTIDNRDKIVVGIFILQNFCTFWKHRI